MAFGANKGTWTFGANSIVASNAATLATGSAVVAKGDLIVVVIGEQTGNTSSGASDTLGNTYTAATAGTLGGGVSGRAFYTIVTNAGTNTNINVAATASGDNVAIVAASFEGSFSAVDKTPANNNNTDNASPFTCPATGTLAQQLEVIIAWMVDNTTNVKLATSPNTKANQQSQVVISTVLGYQTVNVTTTVSPAFTGTNPTGSQQGTLTFRAADLPAGDIVEDLAPVVRDNDPGFPVSFRTWSLSLQQSTLQPLEVMPFYQTDWPLTPAPIPGINLGSWALNLQQSTLKVDYLPASVSTWARPPEAQQPAISWFGAIPPPEPPLPPDFTKVFRGPLYVNPKGPEYPIFLRAWGGAIPAPLSLITAIPPFRQSDWPLPIPFEHPINLRAWSGAIRTPAPLGIVLPPGQASIGLPPSGYEFSVQLRSWVISPRPVEVVPVVISYVFRGPLYTNPLGPEYSAQLRTWTAGPTLAAPTIQVPFNQEDWQVIPAAAQFNRSFGVSLNFATLPIPIGKISTDLTVKTYEYQSQLRAWAWSYNLNLIGKDKLPTGAELSELPPQPAISAIQLRTWINAVNLALVTTPPVRPFAQYDWPLAFGPQQPTSIFTATYNKNLIGQDKLPFRQQYWPNPAQPPRDLVSWIDRAKSYLQSPHRQRDWPLPRTYQQPAQTFISFFNLNLIGKDQLPVGEVVTGLPPQPALSAAQLRTWISAVNLALVAGPPPVRPVGKASYDLPVPAALHTLRSWISLVQPPPAVVVEYKPVTIVEWSPPLETMQTTTLRWIAQSNFTLLITPPVLQPPGNRFFERTPAGHLYSNELRSWLTKVNLALVTPPVPRPFRQTDWPLSPAWALRVAPKRQYDWIRALNPALTPPPPVAKLPFNQYTWPVPRGTTPGFEQRYTVTYQGNPILPFGGNPIPPPPEPTPPEDRRLIYNAGNEWQMLDRIREPGPVGWR